MNARTKLKRAEQARKRRAKMSPGKGWTKVSKRGAAITVRQYEYNIWKKAQESIPDPITWGKKPLSEILDKLFGHARY